MVRDIDHISYHHICCNILPPLPTVYSSESNCRTFDIHLLYLLYPLEGNRVLLLEGCVWAFSFFFWLCRQLKVVFTSPCVCDSYLHCHMNSLNRCSSRRFSCIFLRRPQAPMTTNGWLYKPSLEYVQVGFSLYFHFSLCHLENRSTLIGALDVVQIYLLVVKKVFSCTEMLNNTSYELLPFSRDCRNKVAVSSND